MPPPPLDIIVVAHIPSNPPFVALISLIYEFTTFKLNKQLVPIMMVVKHHQNIRANKNILDKIMKSPWLISMATTKL